MPEETAAYQVYKHRGKPLNLPIIKAILRKCLVDRDVHRTINPQQDSLTVHEFKAKIQQYHQHNGGAPIQLEDAYTPFYDALCKLEEQDRAERYRERGRDYWKLIPCYEDGTPVERLVAVIRQERERLDAEIETLHQRKAQLDAILSNYE